MSEITDIINNVIHENIIGVMTEPGFVPTPLPDVPVYYADNSGLSTLPIFIGSLVALGIL